MFHRPSLRDFSCNFRQDRLLASTCSRWADDGRWPGAAGQWPTASATSPGADLPQAARGRRIFLLFLRHLVLHEAAAVSRPRLWFCRTAAAKGHVPLADLELLCHFCETLLCCSTNHDRCVHACVCLSVCLLGSNCARWGFYSSCLLIFYAVTTFLRKPRVFWAQ